MHTPDPASPGSRLTQESLERHLWSAADLLRGLIPSGDYRHYVLGLLFLKRLSDRFEEESEAVQREGRDPEDRDEHQFFVPPRARWRELQKVATGIGEALNRAAAVLEEVNPALEGVLAEIDFNDERKLGDARQRESALLRLVHHFSQIELRDDNLSESYLLGGAYENVLARFADDAAKRGGEFSTPHQVTCLIVEILQPREGMRICDPACGSGSMLVQCAHYLRRNGGDSRNLALFGQEKNGDTWTICKMNMLLHGLPDAKIVKGDTLRNPKLTEMGDLMSFDLVLSNPPVALSNWGREMALNDPWRRFRFGIPPEGKADYAFLQHMVSILNSRGHLAAVLPQGALSREGQEGQIRRRFVENDLIEAVIGLPSGILYGTRAAPAILLISQEKPLDRRGRILFVDASRGFDSISQARIAAAVLEFRQEEGFSKIVTIEEVADQGFKLQADLYRRNVASGERLDSIADICRGKGKAEPSAGGRELPVLQGRDLAVRRLSMDDLARWPVPGDASRAVLAREGDILLQRIGLSPMAMVVAKELAGSLVSDTVYVIRLRHEHRPKAAYLVGFLNSAAGQKRLTPQTAVVPTLNLKVLRALRIPLPSPGALELFERMRAVEDDLLGRVQRALEIRSQLFEAGDAEALETEMRRLSVEAELLRESIVHAEDLDFQIRNFYPHMIAYGYRRLGSVFDDQRLYREQLGLLETFLAFLGSLGLSLAASVAGSGDLSARHLSRQDLEEIWTGGASVGCWLNMCHATAAVLREKVASPAAGAFVAMWSKKLARTMDRLVKMRNDNSHGRGPQTKREFRNAAEEFGGLLKESLKAGLFLLRHPIRLVEGLDVPWEGTGAIHNTLVYRADHPSLQREDIWYSMALPKGHLYIELEEGAWLSLYPLLSIEETGNELNTYAIDRFDSRQSRVELKGLGHSQVASSEHAAVVGRDFVTWLDKVFRVK